MQLDKIRAINIRIHKSVDIYQAGLDIRVYAKLGYFNVIKPQDTALVSNDADPEDLRGHIRIQLIKCESGSNMRIRLLDWDIST